MENLHVEVSGDGPDLVLLHGWAMHSGIWGSWSRQLGEHFRVHAIDLPGHGWSESRPGNTLQDWSDAVLGVAPQSAHWLGWSLGGLVAQYAACRQPDRIQKLVLMASTPCFVATEDWPDAVPTEIFDQFSQLLADDTEKTILRFLSLQLRGCESAGQLLKKLRQTITKRPMPSKESLRIGLTLLRESDLRGSVGCDRLYFLLGGRDALVPASLPSRCSNQASKVIEGAGHAPFLSHPDQCTDFLINLMSIPVGAVS